MAEQFRKPLAESAVAIRMGLADHDALGLTVLSELRHRFRNLNPVDDGQFGSDGFCSAEQVFKCFPFPDVFKEVEGTLGHMEHFERSAGGGETGSLEDELVAVALLCDTGQDGSKGFQAVLPLDDEYLYQKYTRNTFGCLTVPAWEA